MHLPDAAIRAAQLFLHLEAARQLLKRSSLPSSRLPLCLPLRGARLCRKARRRHSCRRTPLLRVNNADAAAAAAPARACSGCACVPAVPDKPARVFRVHRIDAAAVAAQQRRPTQYSTDCSNEAFTLTLAAHPAGSDKNHRCNKPAHRAEMQKKKAQQKRGQQNKFPTMFARHSKMYWI